VNDKAMLTDGLFYLSASQRRAARLANEERQVYNKVDEMASGPFYDTFTCFFIFLLAGCRVVRI